MSEYRYAYSAPTVPAGQPLLAALLYGAAGALAALAARLAARAARPAAERHREFEVVVRDGRTVGMLYEDGRLVALLPEIGRL